MGTPEAVWTSFTGTATLDRALVFVTTVNCGATAAASTACYPLDKTWHGKVRQQQVGGGAKGLLVQREAKLLFLLVSQKTNPLQTMPG